MLDWGWLALISDFFLPNDSRQSWAAPLSLILLLAHSHDTAIHNNVSNHSQCANMRTSSGDGIFLWQHNGITELLVAVAPEERESDGESKREGIRSESEPSVRLGWGERDQGRVYSCTTPP